MSESKNSNNSSKPNKGLFGNNGDSPFKPNFYWLYAVVFIVFIAINFLDVGNQPKKTSQHEFENTMLKQGDVEKVIIVHREKAEVFIKEHKLTEKRHDEVSETPFTSTVNKGPHYVFEIGDVRTFIEQFEKIQANLSEENKSILDYDNNRGGNWEMLLSWLIPIGIILFLWFFVMRRMSGGGGGSQIFSIGKSKATLFDKDMHVNITFNDIAGLEEAKTEIKEIVDFLKNPKKYTALGGKIPRGALLVGPPGTGKTLLAKAVAGEAQTPFYSLSGSDFVEMFVGVGASRVRDLFKQAKEKAPSIIFIDEIDAIGRARGKSPSFSTNDERESTLNQLLTEMDGFGSNTGVIILAATNRADVLDRALLRPGRFDRQIYVELPDLREREQIFKVHAKPLKVDDTVDLSFLAKQTPGFSGADIANLCNEAALIAARRNKKTIGKQDFLDSVDRIIGGLEKKNKIISPHEKKVIAYHESGHAAVSWLLKHAHPLVKVTIVPRGNSLGAAWYLPEERQLTTKEQIFDEMCAALGGRAAEEIIFGTISTGALSDLEKITKQAYASVTIFGLNEKLGNISYYDSSGSQDYNFTKPYSEKTAELIDAEVKKLVDAAYAKTKEILEGNKDKLDQLAKTLLEKEVIFKEDLESIFGKKIGEEDAAESAAIVSPTQTNGNGTTESNDNTTASQTPKPAPDTESK
ncbi:MAG: ATP-dependent zinc metalloprotease FtsH [Bacteroidia bacterium]|nr:ATP-dependent zinc metalloprotease FtsH [Bacteroidia bacterium]NNM15652.1 ATP-dependent zinc metalloprotease FtsH [Bacteroidia bacterium]